MDLQLDYSFMDNIESILNLNDINIETSNNSFYFPDLNEINEILGYAHIVVNKKPYNRYNLYMSIFQATISKMILLGICSKSIFSSIFLL